MFAPVLVIAFFLLTNGEYVVVTLDFIKKFHSGACLRTSLSNKMGLGYLQGIGI